MKQKLILFFITIISVLFSGCTTLQTADLLTDSQKHNVYQRVLEEIKYLKDSGDQYRKDGYIYDAIQSYEKVNFYEREEVYSKKFMKALHHLAKKNGKYYYQKSLKTIKKDKFEALYLLNKMMRNDPTITQGVTLLEKLETDPEIKAFLVTQEQNVFNELKKNNKSAKAIESLNKALNKLIKYDNKSKVIAQAREMIQQQHTLLIDNTIALYKNKKYTQAKQDFQLLQSVYTKDETIVQYLNSIALIEDIQKAEQLLANKKYPQAIQSANTILKKYPNNKEAQAILETSKNDGQKEIQELAKKGIKYYREQRLYDAKAAFQNILKYEPKHNIALTYIKKINYQLNTIKKLQ